MKQKHNQTSLKLLSAILVAIIFVTGFIFVSSNKASAAPATFEVNSINDGGDANNGDGICETSTPGECTLRAAIEQANTNANPTDQDKITFDISGTGLHTIVSSTQFTISQSLEIDGYTQAGSLANSQAWPAPFDGNLTVEIDSSNIPNNLNSFSIASNNVTIRGLVTNGSPTTEFIIDGSRSGINLYGNYIGTDSTGLVDGGSTRAIFDLAIGNNLNIGGSLPEERNIISSDFGAITSYSDNLTIQGNYLGVGADGVTPLPTSINMNTYSLDIRGDNAQIGGTSAGEGNSIENVNNFSAINIENSQNSSLLGNRVVGNQSALRIAGNSNGTVVGNGTSAGKNILSGNDILSVLPCCDQVLGDAVILDNTNGVSIKGNYIGVSEDGTSALGNGKNGIYVVDSDDIIIGGDSAGDANIIANNGQDGIAITGGTSQISILGNSIYANGELGIDLSNDGVTGNDLLDPDSGPNDLLNYPKLLNPVVSGGNTDVTYRLDVPAGDYRVEFFSNSSYDASGYGEGEEFIGSDTVTSLGSGVQLFTTTVTGDTYQNVSATITQIDPLTSSGYGVSSEFSPQAFTDENMSVTKTIVDQDTIATDGTIQYIVTITNTGSDPIDLTQYSAVDSGDPLNTALFNEIFPNNLTLDSVSGDVNCSEQNPSSDFGTLFSTHTNNTVASCEYTGLSSSLNASASMAFTLTFSLADPALNTFTNYVLMVPAPSDGDYSQYTDAVSSGNDILNILADNIDSQAQAVTTTPSADVSMSKQLLTDSADVQAGGVLSYQLTFTNEGDDPLFIGNNKDTNGSNPLFLDFIHPDLSVSAGDVVMADVSPGVNLLDVNNGDMTCLEITPGLAAVYFSLVEHADYGVVACWYTGTNNSLASGDSYIVEFDLDVSGASGLDFANYAFAYPAIGGSADPDQSDIDDASSAGGDLLDDMIKSLPTMQINNFAVSTLPIDVTVTSEVVDPPATISEGTPIKLKVTLQNNGPASFRFSDYPIFDSAVFSTLFSGNDLTFEGVEDNLIFCINTGTDGAAFFNVAGQDHPGLENVICVGAENNIVVPAGGSQDITLLFSAKSTVSSSFDFYSANVAASSDPDVPGMFGELMAAEGDILNSIDNNNWSRASYTGTVVEPDQGGQDGSGNVSGSLTATGEDRKKFIVLAGVLLFVATTITTTAIVLRRQKPTQK